MVLGFRVGFRISGSSGKCVLAFFMILYGIKRRYWRRCSIDFLVFWV